MPSKRLFHWTRSRLMGVSLSCTAALLCLPVAAQDGSVRKALKDRLQLRQTAKAEAATADVPAALTQPGDHRFSFQYKGQTRMYRLHLPASYRLAKPVPLLFALHGGGGNMDLQADDARYGLISKSEKEGFVLVFPNGYSKLPGGKLATWNAGNCCAAARDEQVDDVGFIRELLTRVTQQVSIDNRRIYATGMSNGAMMAYRLACEMSDVFSAIAPVAGTDNTRSCQPEMPVSVLHIHARDDSHVLFDGGAGPDSARADLVTNYVSVPDTLVKWMTLNTCTLPATRVLEKEEAYCDLYAPCKDGAEVQLCVTQTGGHSWPGGDKSRSKEPSSQAMSAVDVMWAFFNRVSAPASVKASNPAQSASQSASPQ